MTQWLSLKYKDTITTGDNTEIGKIWRYYLKKYKIILSSFIYKTLFEIFKTISTIKNLYTLWNILTSIFFLESCLSMSLSLSNVAVLLSVRHLEVGVKKISRRGVNSLTV